MKKEYLDFLIRVGIEIANLLKDYLMDKINGRKNKNGRKRTSKKKR